MLIIAIVFTLIAQVQTPRAKQQQTPKESQQQNSATTKAVEAIAADLHAINQRQAKEETQRPKQEPQTWRDGFTPATWSNWSLVVFAILATIVGIRTLGQLKRQTTAAVVSANAAKVSADAVMLAERAYIMTDSWAVQGQQRSANDPLDIIVSFKVKNPSRTAARIERVELTTGPETITREVRTMVAPNEFYPLTMTHIIDAQDLTPMDGHGTTKDVTFNVSGRIAYADIFRKTRHRKFARTIVYNRGSGRSDIVVPEFAGVNGEEEWNQN